MRKFILFLVFGGFVCIPAFAQWVTQTAPVTFEARGVHMTSTQAGYIVGSGGNMLKTTDGGLTWNSIATGTSDTLRSLFFTDPLTGFIVGAQGTIRKTTDGGLNWVAQISGVTNLLRSVYFVNSSVGYICGGGGVILKTTNGGNNWVLQSSGTVNDLINIRFSSLDTGYAVSSLSTFMNGLVLKTTDGGTTWNTVYTNAYGLLGLAVKGNVIYAGGGYQIIVKSNDAGNSWTQVNPASANANHFRSAAFISADTGYVVGDLGLIYYTKDGGATWTNQSINTLGVLSVFIVNKDTIFACGLSSDILRYTTCTNPGQAEAIFGSSNFCANDTATFYISPVQGTLYYNWQVPADATILTGQGDTLISVHFGATSGFVSVSDSNLCGSSPSTQTAITLNPAPPVPTITQNTGTLTSSSATGNQWYLNGTSISGATGQTFSLILTGTYTVKVTLPNGCSSISPPFLVLYTVTSDIGTLAGPPSVVPNPAAQLATLNFQLIETASVEVSVFEIIGNKVLNIAPTRMLPGQHQITLDCKSFSKGIYLLKMLVNDKVHFIKFLRE